MFVITNVHITFVHRRQKHIHITFSELYIKIMNVMQYFSYNFYLLPWKIFLRICQFCPILKVVQVLLVCQICQHKICEPCELSRIQNGGYLHFSFHDIKHWMLMPHWKTYSFCCTLRLWKNNVPDWNQIYHNYKN